MIRFCWWFWLPPLSFQTRFVLFLSPADRTPSASFSIARFRSYLLRLCRRFSVRRWFRRPVIWWV